MSKVKSQTLFFTKETIFVPLIILFVLILNFSPLIYQALQTPPGRVFLFTNDHRFDYSAYLSYIKQGTLGHLAITNKMTTETTNPHYFRTLLSSTGIIGGFLNLEPILIHLLTRLTLSIIYLLLVYKFLCLVFKNGFLRKLSFLLFAFSTQYPNLPLSNWAMRLNVATRISNFPSWTLGKIGIIASFLLFLSLLKKLKPLPFFSLCFLAVFTALNNPFNNLLFQAALFLFICFSILLKKQKPLPALLLFFFYFFLSNSIIFYYRFIYQPFPNLNSSLTNFTYEKSQFLADASIPLFSLLKDYFLSLGPILPLALLGLIFQKSKTFTNHYLSFLFSFLIVHFAFSLFLFKIFSMPRVQFNRTIIYLPLSVFAVQGLLFLKKSLPKKSIFKRQFLSFATIFLFLLSLPNIYAQTKERFLGFQPPEQFDILVYPKKTLIEALNWLDKNSQEQDVVLAEPVISNLVPFISRNTAYLGYHIANLNYYQKQEKTLSFLNDILSETQAEEFLKEKKIKYVLDTKLYLDLNAYPDLPTDLTRYKFLKPVYQNPDATIYKTLAF